MIKDGKLLLGTVISGSNTGEEIFLDPKMANRHGLITGATGTGKTTTLKTLVEGFSEMGVPSFFCDVKGDLAGLAKSYPVTFWDIFQENGIALRATVSEMGPILLSKLLGLNDTQSSVLTVIFKIADDEGLLLTDTKDLKAMLNYVVENSANYTMKYGNIAKASADTIIRNIVALETKGGEKFFTEPALNIADWFSTSLDGKGMINLLDCQSLVHDQTMYSTFLIWMFSELFETLPEVGDLDKPRMVFFFDEAHLIFSDMSKALKEKFVQVVKLIRSKGVGVYFISQSPMDIPDEVLSQLGNKIQHGLRAYTPNEEKVVRAVSGTFRTNPEFDTYETILNLGTGETVISTLEKGGVPGVINKVKIQAPQSMDVSISSDERSQMIKTSNLYLKYQNSVDNESAYEFITRLNSKEEVTEIIENKEEAKTEKKGLLASAKGNKEVASGVKKVARTAAGTIGREVGKTIGKTVGGTFGKTLGGNVGAELARSILGTLLK